MTPEELNTAIYHKMEAEQDSYRDWLLTLPPDEILQHAYGLDRFDVYHSDMHAFDMMQPNTLLSIQAAETFTRHFAHAQKHFFAPHEAFCQVLF